MKELIERLANSLECEMSDSECLLLREYLKKFQRYERIKIVASLKNVDVVEQLLIDTCEILDCYVLLQQEHFQLDDKIYKLLRDSDNTDLIIKYFDKIKLGYLKKNLLYLIVSDDLFIKRITELNDEENIFLLASLLQEDKNKVIALKYIKDANLKTKIICNIQDQLIRANELMKLPARYRRMVCKTITEQVILRDLYEKNIQCFFSYEILCLIHDDELKKKMIDNYNVTSQIDIINSLDDENNIMEFIFLDKYDCYCDSFVLKLSENNLIKYFNKLKDLSYKIRIINKIEQFDLKKKLIYALNNYEFQKNLLGNLMNDKEKILEGTVLPNISNDIDNKISIGVELEICCDDLKKYLTLGKLLCDWEIKLDRTVEDGIEITSPILYYNDSSMRQLKYICDFLKRNNFYTNDTCGGHIHLGFDYFENCHEFRVFLNLYQSVEEILYLITNRVYTTPRPGIKTYAKRLSPVIDNVKRLNVNWDKMTDLSECVTLIKRECETRYYALNLSNALDKKNTIEFRMPNGEFEFTEILLNIRLFVKMIECAKRIANIIDGDNLSREQIAELKIYKELISANYNNRKKMKLFLELLFDDKDKKQYFVRYKKNNLMIK